MVTFRNNNNRRNNPEEKIEFLNLTLIVQNLITHLTMRIFREKTEVETIIMHLNWLRSIMI